MLCTFNERINSTRAAAAVAKGVAVVLSAKKEINTTVVFIYLQGQSVLLAELQILAIKTTVGTEAGIINICI